MKDKVILFDGKNLNAFVDREGGSPALWEVKDGIMTVTKHDIVSKLEFGDAHIHVEFRIPDMPEESGQGKGNSGVFVQGCYEIQVLDSYGVENPRNHDCGGIYEKFSPLINASLAPMEWQTYEIYIRAAKLNADGSILSPAVLTVVHNGKLIHNNITLPSNTPGGVYGHVVEKGPLMLQDHQCPARFGKIFRIALHAPNAESQRTNLRAMCQSNENLFLLWRFSHYKKEGPRCKYTHCSEGLPFVSFTTKIQLGAHQSRGCTQMFLKLTGHW